ncbi:MAG: hypothetical protein GXO00_00880 [Candidatus Diapherotrites archaeon]|nr:hypothetical protein [Candidatus Diapherotrites archaeon]
MRGYVSIEVLLIGAALLGLFYGFVQPTVNFLSSAKEELSTTALLKGIALQIQKLSEMGMAAEAEMNIYTPVDLNVYLGSLIRVESGSYSADIRSHVPLKETNLSIPRGINTLRAYYDGNAVVLEVVG